MDVLLNGLDKLNIKYTNEQLKQINSFYEMLLEKNKVMNLTRITDRKDFYLKHILDSLLITELLKIKDQTVIDIGTGAGFPGIPLKIFFPEINLVLLESVNKKINFLNDVIEVLGFNKTKTIHGRSEDIAHLKDYREGFDIVLSRAVADMSVLSELCLPFVKKGGIFIAYKTSDSEQEIIKASNAVKILSGSSASVYDIEIPGTNIKRKLVKIIKTSVTHKKYPRKAGIPKRNPII